MSDVTIDPRVLADLLRSTSGPIVRDTIRRATRVQVRARELVGKDTRQLEASIVQRIVTDQQGVSVLVGTFAPEHLVKRAKWHHDGTKPHVILPRKAKVLRFPKSKGSSVYIFAKKVNHPGTKPNPYLVNALPAAQ